MNETWTLQRIQQMIADGIEEDNQLDYKGAGSLVNSDKKKNEISKDVSAFANANGGVIIYGVREFDEQDKSHLPEKVDPINRTDITKEWLEQIIQTKIHPKIEGIEITPIEVSKTNNTVIYVVEIPKSNTAHQAAGHKYHKRYNFECVPMEDYEIRDVMNRGAHPNMTLEFEVVRRKVAKYNQLATAFPKATEYDLEQVLFIRIKNKGNVFANYVNFYLKINKLMLSSLLQRNLKVIEKENSGKEYCQYYGENTIRDVIDSSWNGANGVIEKFGPSRYDPILPGTISRPEKIELTRIDLKPFHGEKLSWTIYADNALPKKGSINIEDIPIVTENN